MTIVIIILTIVNVLLLVANFNFYLGSMNTLSQSKTFLSQSENCLKDAKKELNDAEYKRWQVIHNQYIQNEIASGKEELTMLHSFIIEHGGCKGDKNIWG